MPAKKSRKASRSAYAGVPWKERPSFHFWHKSLLAIGDTSLRARRISIRSRKPPSEVQTRLKRIRYVRGRLPKEVLRVLQRHVGWGGSTAFALDKLPEKFRKAIEVLHRKECPNCPWDGHTLFPKPQGADHA